MSYRGEILRYLDRIGATAIAIDGGRCGHPQLSFRFRGCGWRTGIASSPGDRNGAAIKISEIRRLIGLTPLVRREGHRRRHAIRRRCLRPARCPVLTALPDWHQALLPLLAALLAEERSARAAA